MRILCFAGVFSSIVPLHAELIKSTGKAILFFRIEMIRNFYGLGILLLIFPYGLNGLAWGTVSLSIFNYIICSYPSWRSVNYGLREHLEDLLPNFIGGVIPTVLAVYILSNVTLHPFVILLMKSIIILAGFIIFVYIFRRRYFCDVWELVMAQHHK